MLSWGMAPRVALVLGKPPRAGTIIADVRERLESRDIATTVHVPSVTGVSPTERRGLAEADLVVHRGLSEQFQPLLRELAETGVDLCNPWTSRRDRGARSRALLGAGIPTPEFLTVSTWEEVLEMAEASPVVAKAAAAGRGSGVVAGWAGGAPGRPADSRRALLPPEPPGAGPYVVEQFVEHDGNDRKLYVAGDTVLGLLKPSTLTQGHVTRGRRFPVPALLRDLALEATAALDLHLAGIDVVEDQEARPWVVDVNEFPGYRSVEGAAQAVATHLIRHLD